MDLVTSPEFRSYVERLTELHHVPGIAIAVVHGRETVSVGIGKASLDSAQSVTGDTLFCIGSVCKSLTAAAVALLVNDNVRYPEVQFEAPMSSLLPEEFVLPGEAQSTVTVADILSHQSGMPDHEYSLLGCNAAEPDDAVSVVKNLRNLPVAIPPKTEFIYCNAMYTAASYLVERISGISYADYIEQHFLLPLNMNSTFVQPDLARTNGQSSRMALGYLRDAYSGDYQAIHLASGPECQGAGKMVSSVNDYIKWVRAMVNREGPITEEIFKELIEERIREFPEEEDKNEPCAFYAFGWKVSDYCGHQVISQDGGESGYGANHFFLPKLNFGAVIFMNCSHADELLSILTHLLIDHVVHKPQQGYLTDSFSSLTINETESDNQSESSSDEIMMELELEIRREFCPSPHGQDSQTLSLSAYTGKYWNPGYKYISIEDKDGSLIIDARERSSPFTAVFAHVCDQTKYVLFLSDVIEKRPFPVKAEFVLDDSRAKRVGIQLEHKMEDYIWFEKHEV